MFNNGMAGNLADFFLLFGPFSKDFHKYAPGGILSKNGP
jgi:hypothetical protein